jgi:A/G-specific adenine glycosylase
VKVDIAALLAAWYQRGHRDLPWRRTSDPYLIWVSEIMLQQTRAAAAIPYFARFVDQFPTVEALAQATEEEVLAAWSGLGYYSRARNLHQAARQVVRGCAFPSGYEELRALPGVGDYTAAAIASIAFGEPHAAVDGNVLRVVARVENDAADIGSSKTRQRFREIAEQWLDRSDPATFNQAMMELGATVCVPRNPLCSACPLTIHCRGLQQGTATELPIKLRKTVPVNLEALLLVVHDARRVLLRQRAADERRMAGFWDLPCPEDLPGVRLGDELGEFRHTITHHHYRIAVRTARLGAGTRLALPLRWTAIADLSRIPLSTTARKALRLAGLV